MNGIVRLAYVQRYGNARKASLLLNDTDADPNDGQDDDDDNNNNNNNWKFLRPNAKD